MAPKKANGFMTFVFEWQAKNGRNMNIAQATSLAGEQWKKMSPQQREPYNIRAKETPPKNSKKEKLNCLGTPIALVEKQIKEREQRVADIKKYIEDTVKIAAMAGNLKNEKFYFIMINYFIRIIHTNIYVPAEIGIIEFSLEAGVSKKFHTYVNPRQQFYGNVYEAQHHSESTHQLPLPPNSFGKESMSKILANILEFVQTDASSSIPPLYTDAKAVNYVTSALNYLLVGGNIEKDDVVDLEIYPIQELFYSLKCAASDENAKPKNRFVTDAILECDAFEYTVNISCDYHEEIDRSNYCALSKCIRWAFTFADYIAKDLSISYIPGKHMPENVNASIVMNPIRKHSDEKSLADTCDALSTITLGSNYESCNDFETASAVSRRTNFTTYSPGKSVKPVERNDDIDDYLATAPEDEINPWKRHDESKPPDARYFSLDLTDDDDKPQSSTSSRCAGRGRGIAILDDNINLKEKSTIPH